MKQYVVDAFTDRVFCGNPAAVCVMKEWLSDNLMLKIAIENNLSETAFAVKDGDKYKLRWFTPGGEIDLCGHATLGTAYVIMNYIEQNEVSVTFDTRSGDLVVERKGDLYEMNFPSFELSPVEVTDSMVEAMGATPVKAFMGRDLLCVFEREETVRNMFPDLEKVKRLDGLLLQVTAPGKEYDCVSRSFAPKLDIPEDPVCGSAHCHIIPYWADVLSKDELVAYQASKRGGILYCRRKENRVVLSGKAVLYSIAELLI